MENLKKEVEAMKNLLNMLPDNLNNEEKEKVKEIKELLNQVENNTKKNTKETRDSNMER